MFAHYQPVEKTPQLEVGTYKATIKSVAPQKARNGNDFLKVTIEIDGHKGAKPDTFAIYDEPTKGTPKFPLEKMLESYNRNLTSFLDSFGIERGNFDFDSWIGKIGEITVVPQASESGYNEISYVVLTQKQIDNRIEKAKEIAENAKKNAQQFQNAPAPAYAPPSAPMQNFQEDIPY